MTDIENLVEIVMEQKKLTAVAEKQQKQEVREKKREEKNTATKKKKRRKNKSMRNMNSSEEKEWRLVSFDELPEYMKENEYIRGYYRAEWPIPHAFLSIFSMHNETINIWTHLVGFFVFLWFTVVHLGHVPQVADFLGHFSWSISSNAVENASCNRANFFSVSSSLIKLNHTTSDAAAAISGPRTARWPFFVFLAGSMFCLLTSSLCHLLCCHSRRLTLLLTRLDYTGIAVMIAASFFPPIYYIFQCEPVYQIVYLSAISIFGVLTVLTLFSPELSRSKFRSYRAMLFVSMALFGVVPAVHGVVSNWTNPKRNVTLAYEGAMAGAYLTGTAFYVSRVPERWRPGAFDLTGHSHQIFHVFVMLGALAHYSAGLVLLEYRDVIGCDR